MKRTQGKGTVIALAFGLVMLFGGMLLANWLASSFGQVSVRKVSIINSDAVAIHGTLYIPKTATPDTPAPVIISCAGGNTPGTYYTAYQTELARRGFVVLSWDYEGIGLTSFGPDTTNGAIAVADYVRGLDFVDPNKVGLASHSAGQLLASSILDYLKEDESIALSYFAIENKPPQVTVDGEKVAFSQGNVGFCWGKFDENAIQRDWNTRDSDNLQLPPEFYTVFGIEPGSPVSLNTWYGDPANGTGRILITPPMTHCFATIYPDTLHTVNRFFTATYFGAETTDTSIICYWTLLALALAWIGVLLLVFPLGALLLRVKWFQSLSREVPAAKAKLNWQFFFFLLAPGILLAMVAPAVTYWANYNFLSAIPKVFPVQNANATLTFFLLAMVVTIVIALIRAALDKDMSVSEMLHGFRDSYSNTGKALLLGGIIFAVLYIACAICWSYGGLYPMLFQNYLYPLTSQRWLAFPLYFVLIALTQLVTAYFQTSGLRLAGHEKSFPVLVYIANTIPSWLFNFYVMYKTVILQVIGVNGPAESRPYGALLGLVYVWVFGAAVYKYFYKKTGNYMVPAIINAFIMTWASVALQALML